MHRLAASQVLQSRRKTGTLNGASAVTERSEAALREGSRVVSGGGVDMGSMDRIEHDRALAQGLT
jgi:hypothetical protein